MALKIKLIDDWKSSWKFSSMQLNAVAITFDTIFLALAAWDEKFPMNPIFYAVCRILLTIGAGAARLLRRDPYK